jgi:2-haloacid dehalogenase
MREMAEAQAQRWVTFDCYGTLVDWRAGMSEALAAVAGGRPHELLEAYHRHELAVEAGPFRPYRDVLRETLLRASRELGVPLPPGGADVLSERLPEWPVFADVEAALAQLRASGSRLGILSNVDRDLIAGTLRRLPGDIDLVVTAEDVRSYKPALRHFERFATLAGATPATWVHVACSELHDVTPVQGLGVPSIRIRRPGDEPTSRATVVLDGMDALPAAVARLGGVR